MSRSQPHNRFRPQLETLETRLVPTVTYHGGAVLPHVETQAIYLGSDWSSNRTLKSWAVQFDRFDNSLVHGTFMDMLTRAGYGVGRGTANTGIIDSASLDKRYYLEDADIQNEIQSLIDNGDVQNPDSQRLFVVYVEPGVVIRMGNGDTSAANFYGYHSSFGGSDANGYGADVRYAVIAFAGGPNGTWPGLSAFNTMTLTASHEIAEAVTDPDPGYGWTDNRLGEIGDINRKVVALGGYTVQSIVNRYDQAMAPAGGSIQFGGRTFAVHVTGTGQSAQEVDFGKTGHAPVLAGHAQGTAPYSAAEIFTLVWSSRTDETIGGAVQPGVPHFGLTR